MSEIRFRLAKPSDAKEIANIHWHVRERYTQGIFLSLGESFLRAFYKIILDDPWEVTVCAVNEKGKILGFANTTMDAKKQAENVKKHKFSLGVAALGAIIKHPSLFKEVWIRYKSLSNSKNAPFLVHTEGVRGEYWCWLKDDDSLKSVEMSNIKNEILYDLGVREMFFEVDKANTSVYKYHLKVNRAMPVEEITLPNGRVRVMMKKELKRKINDNRKV